jgi:uncharacterized protein with ACT and thioredoxin-like domain
LPREKKKKNIKEDLDIDDIFRGAEGDGGIVIKGGQPAAQSADGEIRFAGKPRFHKTGKKMDMESFPMLGDEVAPSTNNPEIME